MECGRRKTNRPPVICTSKIGNKEEEMEVDEERGWLRLRLRMLRLSWTQPAAFWGAARRNLAGGSGEPS